MKSKLKIVSFGTSVFKYVFSGGNDRSMSAYLADRTNYSGTKGLNDFMNVRKTGGKYLSPLAFGA